MSQLAKAINVDSSLVNRWVNEKRLPSSLYISDIVEYLSKNTHTPLQHKLMDEILQNYENDINETDADYKEKLYRILNLALKNSNSDKFPEKVTNNGKSSRKSTTNYSLDNAHTISLSPSDKLLFGVHSLYTALLSFLETAIERNNRLENKTIFLTFLNELDYSYFSDQRLVQLRNKLLETINKGWQITFLFRLDYSINTVILFIHFILPLLKTGKVNLYYQKNHESLSRLKELYVIPEIGALSCFPTDVYSGIQCGFYLKNNSAIEVFHDYVMLLLKNSADNLIKYYETDMDNLYFDNLIQSNIRIGEQYYYNNSFSELLIPSELYCQLLNRTDLTENEKKISIENYQKQFDGFNKNIKYHISRTIYFITPLEQLCENKIIYLYTYSGIKIVPISSQDIITYLEHVMDVIKNYSNYLIAVIYNPLEDFIDNTTIFIKERTTVFLHVYENTRREEDIRLSIDDPNIIKAFIEYFNSLWNRISPLNKDKSDILRMLEGRIQILRNELYTPGKYTNNIDSNIN